jgi:hypothetical protein
MCDPHNPCFNVFQWLNGCTTTRIHSISTWFMSIHLWRRATAECSDCFKTVHFGCCQSCILHNCKKNTVPDFRHVYILKKNGKCVFLESTACSTLITYPGVIYYVLVLQHLSILSCPFRDKVMQINRENA